MQLICCLTAEVQPWNNRIHGHCLESTADKYRLLNINTTLMKSAAGEQLTSDLWLFMALSLCRLFRPDWFRSGWVPQSPSPDLQRPHSSPLCSNLKVKFKAHRLPEKWIINISQFETSLQNEKKTHSWFYRCSYVRSSSSFLGGFLGGAFYGF